MAVKATELYNADFFSQVGTEYICTGFMFGMVSEATMDKQLTKAGVFMAGQVALPFSTEEYEVRHMKKGGGASTPGTTGMGGSKGGGSY